MYEEMLNAIDEAEDGTDPIAAFRKARMHGWNACVTFCGRTQAQLAAEMNISQSQIQKMLSQPAGYPKGSDPLAIAIGIPAKPMQGPDQLRQFSNQYPYYVAAIDALLRHRPKAGRDRQESPSEYIYRTLDEAPVTDNLNAQQLNYLKLLFSQDTPGKPTTTLVDKKVFGPLETLLKLPSNAICDPSQVFAKQTAADNVLRTTKEVISANVQRLMTKKQLSDQALAALAGVSVNAVTRLLNSKKFCSLTLLTALAAALDVSVETLVTADPNDATKFSPDFSDLPKVARDFLSAYLACIRDQIAPNEPSQRAVSVLLATPFMTHAVELLSKNSGATPQPLHIGELLLTLDQILRAK